MDFVPTWLRCGVFLATVVAVSGFSGCVSPTYAVKVDALARPLPPGTQTFRLRSADPRLGEENLRYREAAEFVRTALSAKGLYEVATEDKADLVVDFEFGMALPRAQVDPSAPTAPNPLLGGGRYESLPITDVRANSVYRGASARDRSSGVSFDEASRPRVVTVYEKFVRLSAREARPSSEGKPPAEIWNVQVSAEDESNDLRKYLPVMVAALVDQLGQDTASQRIVRIKGDGPGAEFIRRGMGETSSGGPATSGKP